MALGERIMIWAAEWLKNSCILWKIPFSCKSSQGNGARSGSSPELGGLFRLPPWCFLPFWPSDIIPDTSGFLPPLQLNSSRLSIWGVFLNFLSTFIPHHDQVGAHHVIESAELLFLLQHLRLGRFKLFLPFYFEALWGEVLWRIKVSFSTDFSPTFLLHQISCAKKVPQLVALFLELGNWYLFFCQMLQCSTVHLSCKKKQHFL